jgi:hypothetical protein
MFVVSVPVSTTGTPATNAIYNQLILGKQTNNTSTTGTLTTNIRYNQLILGKETINTSTTGTLATNIRYNQLILGKQTDNTSTTGTLTTNIIYNQLGDSHPPYPIERFDHQDISSSLCCGDTHRQVLFIPHCVVLALA